MVSSKVPNEVNHIEKQVCNSFSCRQTLSLEQTELWQISHIEKQVCIFLLLLLSNTCPLRQKNLETCGFYQLAYRTNIDKSITIFTQAQVSTRHHQHANLFLFA